MASQHAIMAILKPMHHQYRILMVLDCILTGTYKCCNSICKMVVPLIIKRIPYISKYLIPCLTSVCFNDCLIMLLHGVPLTLPLSTGLLPMIHMAATGVLKQKGTC